MKSAILTLALLLLTIPAFAQTPVAASSLAAPEALPSAAPALPTTAIIAASVNGSPFRGGSFAIKVGDVMTFKLLPPGVTLPPNLTVKVNGKDLTFPSGKPLSFRADKPGGWNIQLDMPGFRSNQIAVMAR